MCWISKSRNLLRWPTSKKFEQAIEQCLTVKPDWQTHSLVSTTKSVEIQEGARTIDTELEPNGLESDNMSFTEQVGDFGRGCRAKALTEKMVTSSLIN